MQILAIDFGLKKVGLAVGNTLTKTSMPISTIFYKSKQELFNLLEKHVIEWKPEFIIIGNPLNMDQTESEMSKLAEKFSTQFSKKFNLAVELVDERLSSFEAKEFAKDDNLDAMAAKLILDSWMNNNEHS
jgi:putative Holliday junction resolvase